MSRHAVRRTRMARESPGAPAFFLGEKHAYRFAQRSPAARGAGSVPMQKPWPGPTTLTINWSYPQTRSTDE